LCCSSSILAHNFSFVNKTACKVYLWTNLCYTNCTTAQNKSAVGRKMHFFNRVNNTQAYQQLLLDTRDKNFITAFGVQPNEKPFIAANVEGFCLYVCSDYVESQKVLRAMQALTNNKVVYVPSRDDVLLYKANASKNVVYQRNQALHSILSGTAVGAVVCIDALMQFLPLQQKFTNDCFTLQKGVCYDTSMVVSQLVACGYTRTDGISAEGEFVMRGDILDIMLPFGQHFRVDFWDDEVEKISQVGEDNLSVQQVDSFDVFPLYDTTGLDAANLAKVQSLVDKSKLSPNAKTRLTDIVGSLALQAGDTVADSVWLLPFMQSSTLGQYLPENTLVLWDEPKMLNSRVEFLYKEHGTRITNLTTAGEVLPLHFTSLVEESKVFELPFHQLSLQTLPYAVPNFQPQAIHKFKTGALPSYANNEQALARDISNWKQTGYEVVVLAGEDGVAPTQSKLADEKVYLLSADKMATGQADGLILPVALERGYVSHTNKLVIIGTRDLGRGVNRQSIRKSKKQAFLSVEKGDYVVHDTHGIGLCEGIQKITSPSGETKDYVVVLYKNGDKLYVPVDSTNMLSRYSGGENPTLSRLGGEDFARVKSKVKSGIKEMSINLLKLYAEREKARGFKYHIDSYLTEEFQQYFPFVATEDQIKCQQEIAKDLTSDRIMDRVLVGDVGYGKTEVAMRAAFDVVSNGYQVAVLAPTTILSEQHYKTFCQRMAPFDIRVECLNRFRNVEQQAAIVKDVALGKVDILIGTHRLLSKDVQFNKLGLLILDEEQRFGVEHKEKIKSIKTNVDVLTMSATPIPRTLHMALSGIRDISTITTPPVERMAVETFVVEEGDSLLCDVITRELARGGQVYCVYNKVQSIDSFAHNLQELLPQAKIIVAHGQMAETALEDAVLKFSQGQGDILVCTTIIENGIDIPNANTLVVMDADKLGLSQLYQLRGRVGRSNKLAYAYFLYRKDKILSEVAYKRLSSITEYSELGSGFKIAMKDLEIRGAGNILGKEQHGHMVKVGYDMYARLLKETVAELKGEKIIPQIHTDIEIDIEAYAPDNYIPLQRQRMDFYQQLASCKTMDELATAEQNVVDVYGTMPRQVQNLFVVSKLKVLANNAGICKVTVKPGRGELTFATREHMMKKEVFEALSASGDRVTPSSANYSVVFASTDFLQRERLIGAIVEFLQRLQG